MVDEEGGGAGAARWVELGRVGAPFGVKGWSHVDSYTDPPDGILDYPDWTLRLASGERVQCQLAEGSPRGERLIARLTGIDGRERAARLTGAVIEVPRSELPPPGRRRHYQADLVGLDVLNLDGTRLGTLTRFVEAPAGTVMVVSDAGAREHWVPAAPPYLQRVELDRRCVWVDWTG